MQKFAPIGNERCCPICGILRVKRGSPPVKTHAEVLRDLQKPGVKFTLKTMFFLRCILRQTPVSETQWTSLI